MLRLTKTDLWKTEQLTGATFLLEAVDADGNVLTNEVSKTATTGDAGTLIFDNLKCGVRYRLTETQAPSGYLQISEYIYFMIHEDGTVSVEDSFYAEAGTTAYNLVVKNGMIVDLPESGGIGTSMFYAIGLMLIAVAAGIYIYHLRKRRCCN
jgi:LPXTG-motif cell wall-anchored protein